MLFEVTKKLVSADCADAGWTARTANDPAAARPSNRFVAFLIRMGINTSLCFFKTEYARSQINTSLNTIFPPARIENVSRKAKAPRNNRGALHAHQFAGDQVCWIAESSQFAPRGRRNVQTSVASIGVSLPSTSCPVVRSSVLSTSE